MKTVKNELNFFKVYKLGPGKHAEGGTGGIIALIGAFALAVGGVFAVLLLLRMQTQQKTQDIRDELARPEVSILQEQVNAGITKNTLLMAYLGALNNAKAGFDSTKFLDSAVLDMIASALPGGTVVKSMALTSEGVRLTCVSNVWMDPATLQQALRAKGVFGSISYNGVTGSEGTYSFNIEALFAREEATTK